MSRVERTENPSERRGSEQLRQAQRGGDRSRGSAPSRTSSPARTPGKAEGTQEDVEEALKHQKE